RLGAEPPGAFAARLGGGCRSSSAGPRRGRRRRALPAGGTAPARAPGGGARRHRASARGARPHHDRRRHAADARGARAAPAADGCRQLPAPGLRHAAPRLGALAGGRRPPPRTGQDHGRGGPARAPPGARDAPVVPPSPWVGIAAARTRRTAAGHVLGRAERLGAAAALALFTTGAAEALAAPTLGRLAAGGPADLIVVEPDPRRASPDEV